MTDRLLLQLPTGATLTIGRSDARVLVQRLWDIAPQPGAAPIAVKIGDALAASAVVLQAIDVSEREYRALRQVLPAQPPS